MSKIEQRLLQRIYDLAKDNATIGIERLGVGWAAEKMAHDAVFIKQLQSDLVISEAMKSRYVFYIIFASAISSFATIFVFSLAGK